MGGKTRVLDHYENQTEDVAAWEGTSQPFIVVRYELIPAVRELLARKVG